MENPEEEDGPLTFQSDVQIKKEVFDTSYESQENAQQHLDHLKPGCSIWSETSDKDCTDVDNVHQNIDENARKSSSTPVPAEYQEIETIYFKEEDCSETENSCFLESTDFESRESLQCPEEQNVQKSLYHTVDFMHPEVTMEEEETGKEMDVFSTPEDINEKSKDIHHYLLPRKSREMYEKRYEELMAWCSTNGVMEVSEDVLLTYFHEKSKVLKSPSLWSLYSMLKATLKAKKDIDLKYFHKLITFLKEESVGYKPKKSKVLSEYNVNKFLLEAPDDLFLLKKVVLIFGIAGACRRDELAKMTTDDVEDKSSVLIVTVPESNTNKRRVFIITNDSRSWPAGLDYLAICRKYFQLRPKKATTNRLFMKYSRGVCSNQVVGTNTIGKIPSDIAKYLGLPEPRQYTGHCFRRTSAKISLT